MFSLSLSLFSSLARKNTLGKSARCETGAAECSANDRRPFKSRRLKSFSTRGSGKHRHGFSSTFQTPAAPSARAHRPGASFFFSRLVLFLTLAHITNAHRAIPRNLYGRYSRRFLLFSTTVVKSTLRAPNNLFDSSQNRRGNKETSSRSNCRRDSSRNELLSGEIVSGLTACPPLCAYGKNCHRRGTSHTRSRRPVCRQREYY